VARQTTVKGRKAEYKGDKLAGWKASAMKVGFYLPLELMERLRDVAWYERKPTSRIVRQLIQGYVDARKRIPKRPKEEAD
jgi:hypothetical protein